MALTPEEVVNQQFTITKFRDGYDLDQVDEFLDTIVEEIRQHEAEKTELREQLEAAQARIAELEAELEKSGGAESDDAAAVPASERTIVVDAPAAPAPATQEERPHEADAVKSSAMLQLALELHDKHVKDGEDRRDEIILEAETKAKQLVKEAEDQRAEELRILTGERDDFSNRIKELREFESEYRGTLRSYIQSQLRNLDGSPEPGGAPSGLG